MSATTMPLNNTKSSINEPTVNDNAPLSSDANGPSSPVHGSAAVTPTAPASTVGPEGPPNSTPWTPPTQSMEEVDRKEESPSSSDAGNGAEKPTVGSAEWHRVRRENHKQVERRRRETINEGINEIARIVPGCEKNKGQILQRAALYIKQLKESESATVEKWTLEKLLTDQAMNELNRQVEVLKAELVQAKDEISHLKRQLGENNYRASSSSTASTSEIKAPAHKRLKVANGKDKVEGE